MAHARKVAERGPRCLHFHGQLFDGVNHVGSVVSISLLKILAQSSVQDQVATEPLLQHGGDGLLQVLHQKWAFGRLLSKNLV